MKKLLLTFSLFLKLIFSYGQDWEALPYIFNSHINEFSVYNNELCIGGNFTKYDNTNSTHFALYNGNYMTPYTNSQQGGGGFVSFTEYNGKLIGGGSSTVGTGMFMASMVLEWDGSTWGNNDYRLNGNVYQVITYKDTLFTASTFESDVIGFDYAGYYNGTSWQQAGSSLDDSPGFIVFDNTLYAYGSFTTAGDRSVKYFARWENGDWVQAGSGTTSIRFPVIFNGKLYAFTQIGSDFWEETLQLVEWNGSEWVALPGQSTIVTDANNLRAVTADNNNIYVAGHLKEAGGQPIKNAARFDGSSWHKMGNALDTVYVNTLQVYNGNLYAGTSLDYTSYKAYIYKYNLGAPSGIATNETAIENFYYSYQNKELVFKEQKGKFSIFKADGGIVLDGELNGNQSVSLADMHRGLYIVKYQNGSSIDSKKIVIY